MTDTRSPIDSTATWRKINMLTPQAIRSAFADYSARFGL